MAATGHQWYVANCLRRYPLHDGATGESDAGLSLPHGLLADLCVRWPAALGRFAFLGAAAVGPGLASVVILAAATATAAGGYTPIATASARRPVRPGRAVDLVPMADGVAGRVVFGDATDAEWVGRFSTPGQSLLAPRCARPYTAYPVTGVGKAGAAARLGGVVRLRGGGDLEVVGGERAVDGVTRKVAVVRLRAVPGRDLFEEYRGPCGNRPESGTCVTPAVETVGGVPPDCDGNLVISFAGGIVPDAATGVVALDYPYGLADACPADRLPDSDGILPGDGEDSATTADDRYDGSDPDPLTGYLGPPDGADGDCCDDELAAHPTFSVVIPDGPAAGSYPAAWVAAGDYWEFTAANGWVGRIACLPGGYWRLDADRPPESGTTGDAVLARGDNSCSPFALAFPGSATSFDSAGDVLVTG